MIMSFMSLAIEFLLFAKNFDVTSDALFKLQIVWFLAATMLLDDSYLATTLFEALCPSTLFLQLFGGLGGGYLEFSDFSLNLCCLRTSAHPPPAGVGTSHEEL